MKSNSSKARLVCVVLILAFSLSDSKSYSQHEIHRKPVSFHSEEFVFTMQKISLSQPFHDTVIPTLCNSGNGLVNYVIVLPGKDWKNCGNNIMDCGKTMMRRDEGYTESEMKALQEQKRRMQQKDDYDWQQQLINECPIDLEGIIRGINTPPLF